MVFIACATLLSYDLAVSWLLLWRSRVVPPRNATARPASLAAEAAYPGQALRQDYIPPEELAGMLASGGGEAAKKHAEALEASQRIGEDNIGHRMLRGMGWQDGQGLGASASGMAAPLAAGAAKAAQDKIGLGAAVCP